MYNLRPYQTEAVNIAVDKLRNYGKPFIVQAATGAGKSLIIADICHKMNEPILILQPSKEILEQNFKKLQSYGVTDISMYSASMNSKVISKYTYATIGSIYKKPELFKHFRYVIIDECHGVNPRELQTMYGQFLKAIDCRNVCGLTATPYRIQGTYFYEGSAMYYTAALKLINRIGQKKGKGYETFWKDIVYKIETGDLIEQGYLCPIDYYKDEVDLSQLEVNSTGADFTDESVDKYWKSRRRLQRAVDAIKFSHENHERTLVFCSSIKQAMNISALAKQAGIEAPVVTGKTPKREREKVIEQFKQGGVKHLLNVGVFTTGFDVPVLDCIVLARPTMSLALYYQMVGRGVRVDPNKPSKRLRVYDLAGVVKMMGRVETIRLKKEQGFKDIVMSEVGRMDGEPLFTRFIKNKPKHWRKI